MKKETYKLKHSLYYDEDGDIALDYRFELNDELREEYSVYDKMWKYIWVFKSGHHWLLTQDKETDDFEKVGE